jgi:glycosyltransferase involved in cell wall biosynthesis
LVLSNPVPKILLVGGDGRPSGVPRHILHLVTALQDMVEITVVSDIDEGGYTPLRKLNARHVVLRGLTNRLSFQHNWRGITGLLQLFRNEHADLIWIHARMQVLMCRLLLAFRIWKPECPVIFTHHGLPYGRGYHPLVHRICKWLEKSLIATCPPQNLVFLNHRMAGWMARDARAKRLARHRVHILPNCADLRPLRRQNDPKFKTLVMTGRTGRQKDYDVAVRLLSCLPAHFRLNLCGPGTKDEGFQTHIAGLVTAQVFSRITFTGPLHDVRQPLSEADAYLLTSRYEGTPIGALEAFEAGLPIILRDFDGANDLISKHPSSLLMGTDNLEYEARRIAALLDHYERNDVTLSGEIKEVWRTTWSPKIFSTNARALVHSILPHSTALAARSGCIRDAQERPPDHRKNEAAHIPVPPPCYTDAEPSVANGLQQ